MMFSRVLLPTDFSPHAERTVRCIDEIPGIGDLVLLHVLESGPDNSTAYGQHTIETRIQDALRQLEGMKAGIERPGLTVRVLVHERIHDDVGGTILAVAATEKADLIAMGAKGKGRIRHLILGSVSLSVLRNARTSVLIVHDQALEEGDAAFLKYCRSAFFRILCPVDFSKPSFDTISSLPMLSPKTEVILLHVIGRDIRDEDLPVARESAEKRLALMKDGLEEVGFTVQTLITVGRPAAEVLIGAEKEDVSLILLSRFGKKDYVQAIGIGSTAAEISEKAKRPILIRYPHLHYDVVTRELEAPEFPVAEDLWLHYHQQKTNPATERLFVTFVDGVPAGVARCRRHPDGLEVDGVFVLDEFRNRGYARRLMEALVPACGKETLYMHSTLELVPFYRTFGFEPIPELELPRTIRDRYAFAQGNLRDADVQPMRRGGG